MRLEKGGSLELRAGGPDAGLAAPAHPPVLTCGAGGPWGLSVSRGWTSCPQPSQPDCTSAKEMPPQRSCLHRRFSRGRVASGPRPVLSKCESRGPATQNPAGAEPLTRVRSPWEVAVLRNHLARVTLEGQSRIQRPPGGAARRPGCRAAAQSSPAAPPPSAPSPDGQVPTPSDVDTWSVPQALVQRESRPRTSVGEALGRGPGSGRRGLLRGAGPHWVYHSVSDIGNTLELSQVRRLLRWDLRWREWRRLQRSPGSPTLSPVASWGEGSCQPFPLRHLRVGIWDRSVYIPPSASLRRRPPTDPRSHLHPAAGVGFPECGSDCGRPVCTAAAGGLRLAAPTPRGGQGRARRPDKPATPEPQEMENDQLRNRDAAASSSRTGPRPFGCFHGSGRLASPRPGAPVASPSGGSGAREPLRERGHGDRVCPAAQASSDPRLPDPLSAPRRPAARPRASPPASSRTARPTPRRPLRTPSRNRRPRPYLDQVPAAPGSGVAL
ncbi:uncharacterized protein LOC132527427 [Lagenorhynchus albirostris]|uniref:uncharacterized protein LOC132527427 n=1 Tax=Lagenorhynchus albirostris TaxID=27610 RepID=UPI0028EAC8C5|nr:uncharacterized protein LOC132527427 [Lagenorhynchus albirostris]